MKEEKHVWSSVTQHDERLDYMDEQEKRRRSGVFRGYDVNYNHNDAEIFAKLGLGPDRTTISLYGPKQQLSVAKIGNLRCIFFIDFYNFGRNTTAYEQEKSLIAKIGKKFFDRTTADTFSAVLTSYGYVRSLDEDKRHRSGLFDPEYEIQHDFSDSEETLAKMTISTDGNNPTRTSE
ncbi:unnamed protein product [Angiostrongylus costaricensis]|uniref:KTSC domain-containing protein n=1 Tax=Angiostrongylus costaricensis TaxID=334426 RepID=A0A0R3PGK4_ANGCS|nr:unnamed protein product [Angiostrongylus costaricensis]